MGTNESADPEAGHGPWPTEGPYAEGEGAVPSQGAGTVAPAVQAPASERQAATPEPHPPPAGATLLGGLSPRAKKGLWAGVSVGFLGLVVWLAVLAPSVSAPLLVAFIIAYLLDPVVDRFEARGMSRAPAIAVILGAFLLILLVLGLLLGPQVARELAEVPGALKQGLSKLSPWIEGTLGVQVPSTFAQLIAAAQEQLGSLDVKALVDPAGRLVKGVYGGTLGALAALAAVVMIPVFAFYLLRDFDELIARIDALLPGRYQPQLRGFFGEVDAAMSSFIRGQIIVASLLSLLYSLGLWGAGLPLAVVVGLIAGLGNMVPYLGTTLGVVLAVALSLLTPEVGMTLVKVGAVFIVVQLLEGWVITPRVVGESVGLSTFTVIVAVLFFGELFGFVGVLIAVPLAAVLKILLREALSAYQQSLFFRG